MFSGTMDGAVYVQTNEPENRVVAFARAADGTLRELGRYATGGVGDGKPHLTSQGSVVLSGDGRHLLVTNVASDEVSVFRVHGAEPELIQTLSSGGAAPKSLAEREGIVYVLNTRTPSVTGFRLSDAGLDPLVDAERPLSAENTEAAQVGFTPDGSMIVITERATDSIITFAIGSAGQLGEMQVTPSTGPTPYGFAFTSGGALVVTEAFRAGKGEAAASSYIVRDGGVRSVTPSVGNGRSEICWAVVTGDDRFAFTTNFADGAVSRYAIGLDGALELEDATAGLTENGRPGLRDEDLTRDGRFLYAVDADSGSIFGWQIGHDGSLASIGSWSGLPKTVAGLAVL
jgi:6-phosphogluconolactonase